MSRRSGHKEFMERLGIVVLIMAVAVIWSLVIGFCPIRKVTGIICPGCGMTRAWLSILHGDIRRAFRYNPVFWTLPVFLWLVLADFRPFRKEICNILFIGILFIIIMISYIYRLIQLYA